MKIFSSGVDRSKSNDDISSLVHCFFTPEQRCAISLAAQCTWKARVAKHPWLQDTVSPGRLFIAPHFMARHGVTARAIAPDCVDWGPIGPLAPCSLPEWTGAL